MALVETALRPKPRSGTSALMSPLFLDLRRHSDEPRQPPESGSVALSILPPGLTLITSGTLAIKLVVAGEERYTIAGREHRLRPGEIMVLGQAGSRIAVRVPNGDPAVGLCINLPIASQRPEHDYPDLPFAPLHMPFVEPRFARLLLRLASLLAQRPDIGPRLTPRLLDASNRGIAGFLSATASRAEALSAQSAVRRAELLRRVERARSFLHDSPGRTVALSELAGIAGLSPFHLARAFQAVHGAPPASYHRRHRLELAADILQRAGRSAAEVALAVGFSDQASFSRAFVRHHGAPPGTIRRRHGIARS